MRRIVLPLAACSIAAQLICSPAQAGSPTNAPAANAANAANTGDAADAANAANAANAAAAGAGATDAEVDPYLWLEDVDGARAMAWVNAENAKTLKVLESDPRYPDLHAAALKVAETQDRIPVPRFLAGDIYNFWQDAAHVRGLWRKTTLADYRNPTPRWSTVLDLDALAKSESANWVWEGSDCLHPAEARCLISLSDGGEDAVTVREFDLPQRDFASRGFALPKSKQSDTWVDQDRLLIASDFGPGTLTASGYPYIVKSLKRGEPLSAAREVFRGRPEDVGVDLGTLVDGAGHTAVLITRGVSFFESKVYLLGASGPQQLSMPLKVEIKALLANRLVFTVNEPWDVNGVHFDQGALLSLDLAKAAADPRHPHPTLVYAPGPRESLGDVGATRRHLIVTLYENVKGRACLFAPAADGGWTGRKLDLPDNASIALVDADLKSDAAFLNVTGFLMPTSLWLVDAADTSVAKVKQLPPQFESSTSVVEQFEATSKDGTKIPYFVVHPATMRLDGLNPTILNAYGGFQVSRTPSYSANIGKLWLERGGIFVLANIRGGGEFGPAWHEAGLKTQRQRVFDDFAAVARDLIERKITSPSHLGIQGGSNGGLLMGVEFTQHPELWNAVDIQVPLLDMLRFEKIAAGASWVGEYGSVANPEERAFLAAISPYQNLKPGVRYPEPLIWTTTKDDRVGPQHARKFAAKLAAMQIPYLFYEETEGGHGAGANLREKAHTVALEMTYFSRKLMN
jgi:prolyl oligopeptidase